ncbi:hypothetical protein C0991_011183 [Blastosporella zonata]|nr:hypothetical protein C0991_011183 [Blastosporella zonata]
MPGVARNSVSAAVFNEACSAEETKHINIAAINAALWEYTKLQLNANDKCIVVDDWILNWDHSITDKGDSYVALHFRRGTLVIITQKHPYLYHPGDFESHCQSLAEHQTGFTTWATLPSLQPSIYPPALDTTNITSVTEHCYPSLHRIVEIIDSLVRDKPHLRTLHVLHDGAWDHPLVYAQHYSLEATLTNVARARTAGWVGGPMKRVTHSGQVPIWWGEADWAVMVDVELAREAEIFVGNGYSSLSTQVVALRLGADGGHVEDIVLL